MTGNYMEKRVELDQENVANKVWDIIMFAQVSLRNMAHKGKLVSFVSSA